jgi:hypothetical protein
MKTRTAYLRAGSEAAFFAHALTESAISVTGAFMRIETNLSTG